jgi:hypothetical protein
MFTKICFECGKTFYCGGKICGLEEAKKETQCHCVKCSLEIRKTESIAIEACPKNDLKDKAIIDDL